jgi:hypothetical protein
MQTVLIRDHHLQDVPGRPEVDELMDEQKKCTTTRMLRYTLIHRESYWVPVEKPSQIVNESNVLEQISAKRRGAEIWLLYNNNNCSDVWGFCSESKV